MELYPNASEASINSISTIIHTRYACLYAAVRHMNAAGMPSLLKSLSNGLTGLLLPVLSISAER